jgi:hypothetical protein
MYIDQELILMFLFCFCFYFSKDGSCNGLQHYAALGRDKVKKFCSSWLKKIAVSLNLKFGNLELVKFCIKVHNLFLRNLSVFEVTIMTKDL